MNECLERFRRISEQQFGMIGERLWSAIFRDAGLDYIPLHQTTEKGAPMMRGQNTVILPDFEVDSFNMKRSVFADSKAKRHPVFYRNAKEWRHGIDRKNWDHYATISGLKRKHCALMVFEGFKDEGNGEWSGALLGQVLDKLGAPCSGFSTQAHMIYWPRSRFSEIGKLECEEVASLCSHRSGPDTPRFKDELWDLFSFNAQVQGRFF